MILDEGRWENSEDIIPIKGIDLLVNCMMSPNYRPDYRM